jgi:hypothetical protein
MHRGSSKMQGETLPDSQYTALMADLERLDADKFSANVLATQTVCLDNLPRQQMYIDLWRELAKSGLLVLPEN